MLDGNWLKAPSGLLRADCSPKPAYQELRKLIKEECWGKRAAFVTDGEGKLRFNGFLGSYALTFEGQKAVFEVPQAGKAEARVEI
jgi:hypothetical protein